MTCLLDTQTWVWAQLQPERLSPAAAALIADPGATACLSPISLYEFLVLAERGRIQTDLDPAAWIRLSLARRPMRFLDVTAEIAMAARDLDGFVSPDPFDRFLLATALVHGVPIVSRDESMTAWGGVRVIW